MLDWREEPIGRHHDRKAFDCGTPELNEYLRRHARQNHEGGGSKTFVAVAPTAPETILGYYSISPASIVFAKIPASMTKGLGRYEVAVYRLARLAVALPLQGRGLGGDLLLAAGARALCRCRAGGRGGACHRRQDEKRRAGTSVSAQCRCSTAAPLACSCIQDHHRRSGWPRRRIADQKRTTRPSPQSQRIAESR